MKKLLSCLEQMKFKNFSKTMKQKKEVKSLNHIKNMVFIENFMFQFLYYFDIDFF
jgi:hypothetical protein